MVKTSLSTFNSNINDVFRLFLKLTLFLPLVIMVVCVNYFVDPAYLYQSKEYEKGIGIALAQGKSVTKIANFNERLVQKYFIEHNKTTPAVVVIGSSRSMQVSKASFNDVNLVNNSVSSASIEDYLGLIYNYYKKGSFPKTLVLGLDPWLLNVNSGDARWESIKNDTFGMLSVLKHNAKWIKVPVVSDRIVNILSLSYFQTAVSSWWKNKGTSKFKIDYIVMDKSPDTSDTVTLTRDRYIYERKFESQSVNVIEFEAKKYANEIPLRRLAKYNELNTEILSVLESIVVLLNQKGVKIVFFFPPYNPISYDIFMRREDTKMIMEAEKAFIALAKKYKLDIYGSYNPANYNLKCSDFYDGWHPKEKAVVKIFNLVKDK